MRTTVKMLLAAVVLLLMGANGAWAYTPTLSMTTEVAGYKAKAFYNIASENIDGMLPTEGDLRYRSSGFGLFNFGSGNRSATITLAVEEGDLLVLEFQDTQNRNATVNSVSGCTRNESASGDYHCFDVNTAATSITVNIGRGGAIIALLVMEKDAGAQMVDYTISYVYDGEVLKQTTGQNLVGATIMAETVVWADGVKYLPADDQQAASLTLGTGDNSLTVALRKAALYGYTVQLSDGSRVLDADFASGTAFEGESVAVPFSQYYLSGSSLLGIAQSSSASWYRRTVTPTADGYVETITYNSAAAVTDVVFFTEGEAVSGASVAANADRASMGSMGHTGGADSYKEAATLAPGKYKIFMRGINGNSASRAVNFKVGDEVVFTTSIPNGTNHLANSEEFTVNTASALLMASEGSAASGVDWFYVQKTGNAEVLTAACELAGFADAADGETAWPVYAITATMGEETVSDLQLAVADEDAGSCTVQGRQIVCTARTDAPVVVTVTAATGEQTTVQLPAAQRYRRMHYDLGAYDTFQATLATNSNGSLAGFTDATGITRYYVAAAKASHTFDGITVGAAQYGWLLNVGYGMNFSGTTSTITIEQKAEGEYDLLTYKVGVGSTWADTEAQTEMQANTGSTVFTAYEKDTKRYIYTAIDRYVPMTGQLTATAQHSGFALGTDGYYYPQYSITALIDGETTSEAVLSVADGHATVSGSTVAYSDAEAVVSVTVSAGSSEVGVELPAPVAYVRANAYDLTAEPSSYNSTTNAGSVNGFTDKNLTRRQYNGTPQLFAGLTMPSVSGQYSYFFPKHGMNLLKAQTVSFSHKGAGDVFVLRYKQGDGTQALADVLAQQELTATGTFTLKSRDENIIYQQLEVYVPLTDAVQTVSVAAAVGGMATLVSPYALDFQASDELKAYTAAENGTTVTFSRIGRVPAYTPVLLRYKEAEDATRDIALVNAEAADAVGTNVLTAGRGAAVATTEGSYANYVLTTGTDGSYGFYQAAGRVVAANRAYLRLTASEGARLTIAFSDDEATAIRHNQEVAGRNSEDGIYDLQGRRMERSGGNVQRSMPKGLYIVRQGQGARKIMVR